MKTENSDICESKDARDKDDISNLYASEQAIIHPSVSPNTSLSISEIESSAAEGSKMKNPFLKPDDECQVKENIPSNSLPPKRFTSQLSRPSHIISSHSSAISYEKTLSQSAADRRSPGKSDVVPRIPSPIKKNSVTLGLSRSGPPVKCNLPKASKSASLDRGNHSNLHGDDGNQDAVTGNSRSDASHLTPNGEMNTTNNRWISTQSNKKQKPNGTGSRTKPISIGLLPTKINKTQKTLNMFVKKDSKTSKYFE